MANKNKKTAGVNHFALLETDDPGDTRLEQPQAAPASLTTEELFGRAYPSAWDIMRNRQKQQYSSPPPVNAKARADSKKKGAQGGSSSAKKQQGKGGRHANGGAAVSDDAPAPRLYSLAEFPSLK